MGILILVIILTILISGMCSLFEATLYSTRMATVESAGRKGKRKRVAQLFIRMKKDIVVPTSAILILNTLANTGGATLAGMYAARELGSSWVPAFSAILTLGILLFSEILPKTYGAIHWRKLWSIIAWPLTGIEKILYPIVCLTQGFAHFFTGGNLTTTITEDEIVSMIRLGASSGELTAAELQLLNAVFHFDEMLCGQVMVPRPEVVFLDPRDSLEKCIANVKQTKHTRFPLCNGSLDEIIGLIHIKDLFGISSDSQIDLQTVARPLRSVPETMPISRLLRQMQKTRQHMALVVNEYGTTVGIITLENVLEQIVGSVQDEFDAEGPEIVLDGKDEYVVQGHLSLARLNRELKLDLYAADANTLSGLLVSRLGQLLKVGDVINLEGIAAKVLDVHRGRATRIRLSPSGKVEDTTTEKGS